MGGSHNHLFLLVSLLIVSQASSEVSVNVPAYATCSPNPACGYFYTADKTNVFCGYLEIPCSELNTCEGLFNYLCLKPGEVCINHPRCQSQNVCYPSIMASNYLCPPRAEPTTTTTTTTTPNPTPPVVIPILEIRLVPYLTVIGTDAGSGANKNLVTFKPDGGNNWFYLGPRAANERHETHFGLIVRENTAGILVDIKQWALIWTNGGAPKGNRSSLWRAITDPEYVALGDFFVRGDQPPTQWDTMFMKAIHRSFCKEGAFGRQIWTDAGSKDKDDGAIWEISNGNKLDRLTVGAFVATPTHQTTSRPLYVLDENKVKRS